MCKTELRASALFADWQGLQAVAQIAATSSYLHSPAHLRETLTLFVSFKATVTLQTPKVYLNYYNGMD